MFVLDFVLLIWFLVWFVFVGISVSERFEFLVFDEYGCKKMLIY